MVLMWVELASSFPQVLVRQLPPPSYPGLAPQEQFPGMISKDPNLISYICAVSSRSWDSHTHYQQFREPPDDYGGWGGPGHILRPLHAAVRPNLPHCHVNDLGFRSATVISRSSGHPGLYYGF